MNFRSRFDSNLNFISWALTLSIVLLNKNAIEKFIVFFLNKLYDMFIQNKSIL